MELVFKLMSINTSALCEDVNFLDFGCDFVEFM